MTGREVSRRKIPAPLYGGINFAIHLKSPRDGALASAWRG
jgi:hypothetical protein